METLEEKIDLRIEQETELVFQAYITNDVMTGMARDEVTQLAKKSKNRVLADSGVMMQIMQEAEEAYIKSLANVNEELAEEYVRIKKSACPIEAKKTIFSECKKTLDDVIFKRKFIEARISLNLDRDAQHIKSSIKQVLLRDYRDLVSGLTRSYASMNSDGEANKFIEFLLDFSQDSTGILYEREFRRILADKMKPADILIYKCLRFTHDEGHLNICPHLDDYRTQDINGKPVMFKGASDTYQLKKILYLAKHLKKYSGSKQPILIVADGDMFKYGPEKYAEFSSKIHEYLVEIRAYCPALDVRLETEYFDNQQEYKELEKRVKSSILQHQNDYIAPEETQRIIEDYASRFRAMLKDWTIEKNQYYSVTSISRNIAQGMFLSYEKRKAIVVVFNNPDSTGARFNLKTEEKVPFIGYPKLSSKVVNNND